jgi:hypothetical protein
MGAFIAFAFIGSYVIASGYFSRPQPAPAVARWSRYEGNIAAAANGI